MASQHSRTRAPDALWALLCLGILAAVAVVDAALAPGRIITSLVILGPLLAGLRLRWPATLAIGGVAVVIAVLAGLWNDYFLSVDHLVRVLVAGTGAGLGVAVAVVRERLVGDVDEKAGLVAVADRALAQLDAVYATAPVGLAFFDRELRFVRVNEVLAAINGKPVAAHLGRRVDEALPDFDAANIERMQRVLREGIASEEVHVQGPAADGSGETRHLVASWYPVRDGVDALLGVGALVRETTEEVRRESALETLAEIGRLLDRPLEVENRLAALAEALMPRLGEVCVIHVLGDDNRMATVFTAGVEPEADALAREVHARRPLDLAGERPPAVAMRTGEPVRFDGTARETLDRVVRGPEDEAGFARARLRAGLSVPMRGTTGIIGALSLASNSRVAYGDDDVRLISLIARRAALAIDNARRYEDQQRVAAVLQAELLPPGPPDWPGFELAAVYRPAGTAAAVGGDFYDFFTLPDGRRTIAIGDVSGKGVEAAALTTVARHGLRVAARAYDDPHALLSSVNRALAEDTDSDSFCTLAYAVFTPARDGGQDVEVSCAGHPAPIVRRSGGRTEPLGRPGTLLGFFDEIEVDVVRGHLAPGDALVLFTDGLTEARHEGELLGEDCIRRRLADGGRPTAAELLARLEAAAGDSPQRRRDDLAIVVAVVGQ